MDTAERLKTIDALGDEVRACMRVDRDAFRRRLRDLRDRARAGNAVGPLLARLKRTIENSRRRRADRRENRPTVAYPDDLPISARRLEIADAIRANPVVIVAGATGCGKTTQLPKICLEMGRGVSALIGCTQPRRIAALSVADRVAAELGSSVGKAVGYQIRFERRVGPGSYIKFMTDGILLSEATGDRALDAYDTIILDEAHERTLNIDYLLGFLKMLLPRRKDLKLIVSSATLDVERFRQYFEGAPVINVEGRTYPVDVRYRPPERGDDDPDLPELIAGAVEEISARDAAGDILVFLPTEMSIRETAELLTGRQLPRTEILALFGRLSSGQQRRVFRPGRDRRIVLATNVAETSLTVPRIRYVIDTGLARVRRFNHQTQIDHLEVEAVSQASADQRKGRCGRIAPGVCVRLFAEEEFARRPPYTDPEIRRTSLASVILQMKSTGLGDVEHFPFIEPPQRQAVRRGYAELAELGALDARREMTATGRQMARLPVEARFARILLEGARRGTLEEMLTIVAALSVRDPRQRPLEKRAAADAAHKRWRDEGSDFAGWLKLWDAIRNARQDGGSNSALRRFCKQNFLGYLRVREWENIRRQLAEEMARLPAPADASPNPSPPVASEGGSPPAGAARLHPSLLPGLLSRIGMRTPEKDYRGAGGARFLIFPGSGLAKKSPDWLMAAEIVLTSRSFARTVAAIEPEWIEHAAMHLVKRSYTHPHWDARSGRVRASETVTLYGLPIVEGRRVSYESIDPEASRRIFIQDALVRGDVPKPPAFLARNRKLIAEVREMENKSRRGDLLVSEDALFRFYDARLPADVAGLQRLDKWLRRAGKQNPGGLDMGRGDVLLETPDGLTPDRFPPFLEAAGQRLPLRYRFDPGDDADGVTCTIPVHVLPHVDDPRFAWLVPGLLGEKVALLLRSLPKEVRRDLLPLPDTVEACLAALSFGEGALPERLARAVKQARRVFVRPEDFRFDGLPPFLRMRFRVVDDKGRELQTGRDLQALRDALAADTAERVARNDLASWERTGCTTWAFGELPERLRIGSRQGAAFAFPAVVDEGNTVGLRLFHDPAEAERAHRRGLRHLYLMGDAVCIRRLRKSMPLAERTALLYGALGGQPGALREDIIARAVEEALLRDAATIRDAASFAHRIRACADDVGRAGYEIAAAVEGILRKAHAVHERLAEGRVAAEAEADLRSQFEGLLHPGFVLDTPRARFERVPVYLDAMLCRIDALRHSPQKDPKKRARVAPFWQQYLAAREAAGESEALLTYRWTIEEFRVSLFAQHLGAQGRVSEKRLAELWERVG